VTLGLEKITVDEMDRVFRQYLNAARLLATQECNVILIAGSAVQAYMGWERTLEMLRTIETDTGIPTTSDLKAAMDALKFLSAKKIIIVSPYEEARNQERKKLCEELGFEVLNTKGWGLHRRVDMSKLPSYASYKLAKQAFFETPEADAIYISCPEWQTTGNIERLEHDTGRPVVAAVQACVWATLREMQVIAPIKKYGKLFELQGSADRRGA
jgi:maleate isomerase